MAFHRMHPVLYSTELLYTLIIVVICFLIYYKVKSVYNLTKHKGIWFFGSAFLFFGLAFLTRFLFHAVSRELIPWRMKGPIVLVFVGFFSTLAIFSLIHSSIWKKVNDTMFLVFSSTAAIVISLSALMFRSPATMALMQVILLAFAVVLVFSKPGKKLSQARILYILILLFWLINLIILGPRRFLPNAGFELQILSVILFGYIYYRVAKWIK